MNVEASMVKRKDVKSNKANKNIPIMNEESLDQEEEAIISHQDSNNEDHNIMPHINSQPKVWRLNKNAVSSSLKLIFCCSSMLPWLMCPYFCQY